MNDVKKVYFLSDVHLGVPNREKSREREKKLVRFLDEIQSSTSELYLLGDIFDFWFEYKSVVPRGYVRLLSSLARFGDAGIPVHYFTGNHDMWIFNYFEEELGVTMHRAPIEREIGGKLFFIGHGDGLGPGDRNYKFLKHIFNSAIGKTLFSWIHPDMGNAFAMAMSKRSRLANGKKDEIFLGEDKEWLVTFCRQLYTQKRYDYFIFGHRHLPLDIAVAPGSRYINTGEWVSQFSYAVFDGEQLYLNFYK